MRLKNFYCIKCHKYKKLKNLKIPYIFYKKLIPRIICDKRGSMNEKFFKEKQLIDMLKALGLIKNFDEY